jgi:hypothetical protein
VTQVPASVTINNSGSPQFALVSTAFAIPLSVTVTDAASVAIQGVAVVFQAPSLTGASGTFSNNGISITPAATNASGVTSAGTFTADGTAGSYTVTATASPAPAANFSLTNYVLPTFSKAFGTSPIIVGGNTTLTFTISNPAGNVTLHNLSFSDPFPSGIAVASSPNASSSCGGTWSPGGGATSVSFSGGTLAGGGTCTISVSVTGTAATTGAVTNLTGDLSSTETGTTSLTASAQITVNPATVQVTIASSPTGLSFSVSGTGCSPATGLTSPQTLSWAQGSSCVVTFTTPQAGSAGTQYVFSQWENGSTSASRTIPAPSSPATYTASFNTQYQLTVASSTGGSATPTSGNYYNSGTVVNLQATANSGYLFYDWTGSTVANASLAATTVTMSAPESVTANFNPQVTITSSPSGLTFGVSGAGCSPASGLTSPQTLSWVPGSSCVVTFATPQAGSAGTQYVFSQWENGTTSASRTITAPSSPATYTASFNTQYQLTTSASPSGAGAITPTSGQYYNPATVVNLQATANAGYVFANWTGAVASPTSAATTITMSAPESVTANFNPQVTITSSPSGRSFSVSGTGCSPATGLTSPQTLTWVPGSSCVVTFTTPQAGSAGTEYVFSQWENGSTSASRTIVAPSSPATYIASFNTEYLLTTVANPAAGGTVSGAGYYVSGSSATVTATPASGYAFASFTGTTSAPTVNPGSVLMNAPTTVTANFAVPTTTTVQIIGPSTDYSDVVGLLATVSPLQMGSARLSGAVQFAVNGMNVGTPVPLFLGVAFTNYTIALPKGTYPVTAEFLSSAPPFANSLGSATPELTVSPEQATVTPAAGNPTAVQVPQPTSLAGPLTFKAAIRQAFEGITPPGNISNAVPVTCTLTPVLISQPALQATATVSGGGVGGTLNASCSFAAVPVNLYRLAISIGGGYYTGTANGQLLVYSAPTPPRASVNGQGTVALGGVNGKFNLVAAQGSLGATGSFTWSQPNVTVSSISVAAVVLLNNNAVATGPAWVNGVPGATWVAVIPLNNSGHAVGQFGLEVTGADGSVVTSFAPVSLTSGSIAVQP